MSFLHGAQCSRVVLSAQPGLGRIGVLAEMVPGSADRGMAPYEGDFIWQDAGQTRAVKNTGTTLIEFVEFELKSGQ